MPGIRTIASVVQDILQNGRINEYIKAYLVLLILYSFCTVFPGRCSKGLTMTHPCQVNPARAVRPGEQEYKTALP